MSATLPPSVLLQSHKQRQDSHLTTVINYHHNGDHFTTFLKLPTWPYPGAFALGERRTQRSRASTPVSQFGEPASRVTHETIGTLCIASVYQTIQYTHGTPT